MSLFLIILLMISIITFVSLFGLRQEFNYKKLFHIPKFNYKKLFHIPKFNYKKLFHIPKNSNPTTTKITATIFFVILGVIIIIFLVPVLTDFEIIIHEKIIKGDQIIEGSPDVSNWITLTAEIGVGVIVAIVVLIYSQKELKKRFGNLGFDAKTTGSDIKIDASVRKDTSSQEDISKQESSSHDQSLQV